jgi:dienelactone hydrolase
MLIPKLGVIDDVYAYVKNKTTAQCAESRFFSKGWGNHAAIGEVQRPIFSGTPPADIEVMWENEWRPYRGHYARDGFFETPHFRAYLPEESRTCYFRIILPEPELRCPVYVHMAASGEEGYAAREAGIAVPLLARRWGSLIVEHPYLGRRRPAAQRSTRLGQVSDLLLLGGTAIEEARSLLQWLYSQGHPRLGITGVSMGGHLAALAGVLTAFDLAIVPYVAPHSAVPVFAEGLIKKACDWEKLAGNKVDTQFANQKLRKCLQCTGIDHFPPPRNQAAVIAIAARDDRFVPGHSVETLSRHWPNAELRWIDGGHVSSILGRRSSHLAALVDAMDMLGEIQKKPARPAA